MNLPIKFVLDDISLTTRKEVVHVINSGEAISNSQRLSGREEHGVTDPGRPGPQRHSGKGVFVRRRVGGSLEDMWNGSGAVAYLKSQ